MNIEDKNRPEFDCIITVVDEKGKEIAPDNNPHKPKIEIGEGFEGQAYTMQIEIMKEQHKLTPEEELKRLKETAEKGVETRYSDYALKIMKERKQKQQVAEK